MQRHGVDLTPEEEKHLVGLDEAAQINELLSKLPKQSDDRFRDFFLQLQLLVSTSMRLRNSFEEGRPDDAAEILDDADSAGILTYMLNSGLAQAGNEVKTMRHQMDEWAKETDNK